MWLPCSMMVWIVLLFYDVDASIEVLDPSSNLVASFFDVKIIPDFTPKVEGYIELANPSDACDNITAPTFPANLTMNKIVLINDTNCDLITKICFAESVGYDTVIFFYSTEYPEHHIQLIKDLESEFEFGKFKECFMNMAVFFMFSDDASVIIKNYLYQRSSEQNYLIRIVSSKEFWIIQVLLNFVAVTMPFLIVSLCCDLFRKCRQWRIKQSLEKRSPLGRLKRLFPTVNFSEGDPYESCRICLSHFILGEKLRVLACSHAYHPDCIDAWILNHRRTCPLCNQKVLLGDSFDDVDIDHDLSENTPLITPSQVRDSSYISITISLPTNYNNDLLPAEPTNLSQNSHLPARQSTELLSPIQGSVNHVIQQNMEAGNNHQNQSSGNNQQEPSRNEHGPIV